MPYQEPLIEQVNNALASILVDSRFNASPQMSAFLTYIVEQTLEGHAARIKAYTIAVDALGKSDDFDPQTNPSVRVLAKRLRDSLSQFYDNNPNVEVKICLKPGSYVPQFETCKTSALPLESDKASPSIESRNLFETKIRPMFSDGFSKYHRQTTVAGIVLMAAAAWTVSPNSQQLHTEPAIAHAKPAQNILAIDIASMEQINRSQERPPLPSITIVNDHLKNPEYLEISNAIHDELTRYEHVIVKESSNADSPKWPEDYILHYTRTSDNEVDIFVSHAKSGKIIQRDNLSISTNTDAKDEASDFQVTDLANFSQALLQSQGSILEDYKTRGEISETMNCAFLFDAYYANKTKENHNAASKCAERLQDEGHIESAPSML